MALADVLRERVSRRGRTAQVDCGELGTVTVEALPPRECSALGMADGGRALLYAACRELQAAGETLRRERRLFTPDEVTQYVSDGEALAAARTVLALSGVTLDEDEAGNRDEMADKADNKTAEPESPDKSDETERPDRTDEKNVENRLETVHETVQQISETRPEIVQEQAASPSEPPAESANRLETVHKNVQQLPKARHEIRPGNVQFPDEAPADGQVSREFFSNAETVRKIPSIGSNLDFEPQNLALSEKNSDFMSPLNLSGETEDFPEKQSAAHETKSEIRGTVHEITSEIQPAAEMGLHEMTSEFGSSPPETLHETELEIRETVHEIKSEFPKDRRQTLHEAMSEFSGKSLETLHEIESDFLEPPHETKSEFDENCRETMHETTSELAEQVAERLLEGLRRAAAVR
ncbi:hypothetical protein JQM68_11430 [Oscillibacter valericigenes]|uniref:hypothetical protein n=1 Tax=Oscillibacter valericigenes TaxID=351091 RepID=UPI001F348BD6|nr:hypothetical protein [Oscillibacter valericigenes]MCF2617797.1 hypothetical protein [Oscillibacter valericigenes]